MVNKTTEDGTRRKVKSGTRGDGAGALYRIVKWFQQVTGLGLSEKRARLMRPGTAKNEGDILGMLENWKKEVRELERMEAMLNEGESMTDRTKVSAIKQMLTGSIKDYMNQKEEDYTFDHEGRELGFTRYAELLNRYLTRKAHEEDVVMGGTMKVNTGGDEEQEWGPMGDLGEDLRGIMDTLMPLGQARDGEREDLREEEKEREMERVSIAGKWGTEQRSAQIREKEKGSRGEDLGREDMETCWGKGDTGRQWGDRGHQERYFMEHATRAGKQGTRPGTVQPQERDLQGHATHVER